MATDSDGNTGTDGRKIRVMIVDDHQVVRQGFALFLKAFQDFELVGEAVNGAEALQLCEDIRPDVILMDMIMPQMNGVEATRAIRAKHQNIQIIALTSFTDNSELMQSALQAGAIGYLFKDISIDDLAKAIRAAHIGTPILSPEATRMLIKSTQQPAPQNFNLTERELEVLGLVTEGLNNREIAEKLHLSRSTIKFHVSSILGKLGVNSRTEAVTVAHQHNLFS